MTRDQDASVYTFTFYGATGQRLTTFTVAATTFNSGACLNAALFCGGTSRIPNVHFAGKMLIENGAVLGGDGLASNGKGMSYYPWGEERTSTANGKTKFSTDFRDMPGQDYADQSYHSSTNGRFWTPDSITAVDSADPSSWSKYAYAGNNLITFRAPWGTEKCADDCPPPPPWPGLNPSAPIYHGSDKPSRDRDSYPECGKGNQKEAMDLDFIVNYYAAASDPAAKWDMLTHRLP